MKIAQKCRKIKNSGLIKRENEKNIDEGKLKNGDEN